MKTFQRLLRNIGGSFGATLVTETDARRKMSEVETALAVYVAVESLREGVATSVELLCDNDSGDPNNAIICCGEWTDWSLLRFEGDSLLGCLRMAVIERRVRERKG